LAAAAGNMIELLPEFCDQRAHGRGVRPKLERTRIHMTFD
jgi:hypothetical protein